MVNVHVVAAVQFARAALPGMRSRLRGAIVNVSSLGAFALTPGSVLYDSTKSFLVTFSENLRMEVEREGIAVQALCPGFTRTEFHDIGDVKGFDRSMIPDPLWMTADDVVRQSLEALEKGRRVVFIPGWKNRLARWAVTRSSAVRAFVARKAEERG
jgi:short-subunit dehydrogenase